ncbi:MAG: permease [Deltaproteobacteria bacterium RIFOXYD12_FULL_57_12]|nr:MAG: permease [Deltaproteobacteria bacterium RIFOXYD12_FULL_57_12]
MDIQGIILRLVQGGLGNLAAYLAAHVLLCLVPAFAIAGCMTALIPKDTVTRFLGRNTPKFLSYPAATLAASVLAVCSCTIVPLFAGIYKKGAGLGPAITFLFFAPAANILALVYTGGIIGVDLALARFFLSLAFGIGIGMIMALLFRREDIAHDALTDALFAGQSRLRSEVVFFLLSLVALLLAGVLKLEFLTRSYMELTLPIPGMEGFQEFLFRLVPFDPTKGEEGVTAQGAILISLLLFIGLCSWKGLENIIEGANGWTWTALGLSALTLLTAASGMTPQPAGLVIFFTGKLFGVALSLALITYLARRYLETQEVRDWLWETWRFVKQIFPLLVAGVFLVGVIRQLLRPEWIQQLAGSNTLAGNLAGVVFGVFMYFPTLVEVPIAKMFLGLGMHRGPLLAYLMADPELSLQSILITSSIIGRLKTWTYVGWVALFSTLAGLLYGAWVDGVNVWSITVYLFLFLVALALTLYLASRRNPSSSAVA